jgi:hypothetical protein
MAPTGMSRPLRIPTGSIWLVVLAVFGALAIAFSIGYGRGKSVGFAEGVAQREALEQTKATMRSVQDPLAQGGAGAPDSGSAGGSSVPAPAPRPGEPRVAGYWYFTLAHPTAAMASQMLEFCRSEGLDAYLVSDDNGKSRKIIVLPALASTEARRTQAGQQLETKIKSVGNRWKAKAKGNRSFSDAQLELYKG